MLDKTFIVCHPKAREPLTITGKTLADALTKEGLSPTIWQEIKPPDESESPPHGDTD